MDHDRQTGTVLGDVQTAQHAELVRTGALPSMEPTNAMAVDREVEKCEYPRREPTAASGVPRAIHGSAAGWMAWVNVRPVSTAGAHVSASVWRIDSRSDR